MRFVSHITMERLYHNRKYFWLSFVLMYISFLLIYVAVFLFGISSMGKRQILQCLAGNMNQYGYVLADITKQKDLISFFHAVEEEIPEIRAIGSYEVQVAGFDHYAYFQDDEGIYEKLVQHQKEQGVNQYGGVSCITLSNDMLSYCGVETVEQLTKEEREEIAQGEVVFWVYIGANYEDIPLGSKFVFQDTDYVVAGRLKPGSKWLSEGILYTSQTVVTEQAIELDDLVVFNTDRYMGMEMVFFVDSASSVEEVAPRLMELVKRYGGEEQNPIVGNSAELYRQNNGKMLKLQELMLEFVIVLAGTAVLIMLCTQSIALINQTKVFGIFYANGMSKVQMLVSFLLENAVKVVIPMALALPSAFWGMKVSLSSYEFMEQFAEQMEYVKWRMCVPAVGIVAALVIVLATLFPAFLCIKSTPDRMMKGEIC